MLWWSANTSFSPSNLLALPQVLKSLFQPFKAKKKKNHGLALRNILILCNLNLGSSLKDNPIQMLWLKNHSALLPAPCHPSSPSDSPAFSSAFCLSKGQALKVGELRNTNEHYRRHSCRGRRGLCRQSNAASKQSE